MHLCSQSPTSGMDINISTHTCTDRALNELLCWLRTQNIITTRLNWSHWWYWKTRGWHEHQTFGWFWDQFSRNCVFLCVSGMNAWAWVCRNVHETSRSCQILLAFWSKTSWLSLVIKSSFLQTVASKENDVASKQFRDVEVILKWKFIHSDCGWDGDVKKNYLAALKCRDKSIYSRNHYKECPSGYLVLESVYVSSFYWLVDHDVNMMTLTPEGLLLIK